MQSILISDREMIDSEENQGIGEGNVNDSVSMIRPEDNRIAILGFWYGLNYGAVMTAFALVRYLESEGYVPTLVDNTGFLGVPATDRDESSVFRKFYRSKAVSTTPVLYGPEQVYELNNSYNTFLIASDQSPCYNVAPYIERFLDSLCIQTYKNLEIILVNDGSPDNCESILKEYAAIDSRIVVINQKKIV